MKCFNYLSLFLLVLVLCVQSQAAFSQCSQKIEVKKIKETQDKIVTVEVKISSSEPFKGQLTTVDGTGEKVLQRFSGDGNEHFTFNLKNEDQFSYRVAVEFNGEDKFLCKKKVKTIDLTDSN